MKNRKNAAARILSNHSVLSIFTVVSLLSACSFEPRHSSQVVEDKQSQALQQASEKLRQQQATESVLIMMDAAQQQGEASSIMAAQQYTKSKQRLHDVLTFAPSYQHEPQETYGHQPENGVKSVVVEPVSTFSIDVDTGSYSNARRMLNQGVLPPADAVRIEEFINYFDYHYVSPEVKSGPFSVQTDIAVSPWDSEKHLIRIALQGYVPEIDPELGRNLVFLLDVSGSMDQPDKLPLLSRSLNLLSRQLSAKDSVAIVVYAGASGVVLAPTPGDQHSKIQQALNQLKAGGATNGHAGIELAYDLAEQALVKNGLNRVILATDGDFNVGIHDHKRLVDLIKTKKEAGIALTTLGFGQGNYNDHLMEQLADAGNGNYYYIDTINEARKVLVDELNSTLMIIAKDVKVQVEFNPANVAEYRLMGYENRALKQEDFNNDVVDAGEIGAGHKVTAFYEVSLVDSDNKYLDPLRYQTQGKSSAISSRSQPHLASEIALVKLRYKPLDSEKSILLTQTLKKEQITDFNQQSADFRFAIAVVGFAHKLKNSVYLQNMDYTQLVTMAQEAKGHDEFGYRAEFIQLLRSAQSAQVIQATSKTPKTLATGRLILLNENVAHQ